jgi:hypothetical protein
MRIARLYFLGPDGCEQHDGNGEKDCYGDKKNKVPQIKNKPKWYECVAHGGRFDIKTLRQWF